MSPEEKKTILQFMGQTYGLSHKLDQDIVGHSQYLKPSSNAIREKFEEVLRAPIQSPSPENIPEQKYTTPNTVGFIEQHNIPTVPAFEEHTPITPSFNAPAFPNNQLIDILEKINLNLARIGDILEKEKVSNGRTKKIKNTGSE